MATDDVPRLVDQLPAPCRATTGELTVGDQCLVLHHPNQQALLADLRKLAESVAERRADERRNSEGYDSASGIYDCDVGPVARKDSVDSCFSSYNSGDLAGLSRELALGLTAAGVSCTVDCEHSLEQRYEALESCHTADYSESESDSDGEDGERRGVAPLTEDRQGDGDASGGEEQSTDEVIEALSSLLHRQANQRFESLTVTDSEAVHVGNVTYILGEVNVKQVVQETSLKQQVFVSQDRPEREPALPLTALRIISRGEWLAQPPSQPAVPVTPPLNLVLINHTATEGSTKMMTNMMLCRRIQLMHMEGNEWWDIGYNYLVGMDGYVYEGRGWGEVGAHTYGYNSRSLGVAFIGCFVQHVPTPQAVHAFHQLVELGVREGHLTPDCRVMANCQCTPSESPGRAFFSLIQTWPRWADAPPPPPPSWDPAAYERCIKQRYQSGAASEATKDTCHSEKECTPGNQDACTVSDFHVGSDRTSSPQTPVSDQLDTAGESGVCWERPSGQSAAPRLGATAGSDVDEASGVAPDRRGAAVATLQGGDQGAGEGESVAVAVDADVAAAVAVDVDVDVDVDVAERRGEAVSVRGSSGVHVGAVSYVLGPLCVDHVLQRSSLQRSISVTRPDRESELCLVQRKEWAALPPKKEPIPLPKPISKVVICHTETSCEATLEQEARHVYLLQAHAMHSRVLQDIAYNFLVGASGHVFEGRGWAVKAEFARGLGVAFIGNFKTQPPSARALEAFRQLAALGEREGWLSADWRALAHCQLVATDSPGRALYQLVKTWPRWAGLSPAEEAGLRDLEVVPREGWLAGPPAELIPKLECPVRMVVICHTGTKEPTDVEGERRQVRSLQDFEIHGRGRADLPSNFLVAPSGVVYEGRGWEFAADLGLGLDLDQEEPGAPEDVAGGGRCLAVALLGTFSKRLPAPPALDAVHFLLAEGQRRGVIAQDYCLVGHCQLAATNSPGEALLSLIRTWPRWTDRPSDDADESDTAPVR